MTADEPLRPSSGRSLDGRGWLWLILLLSALLQVWFAAHKGLVLDEFHSHFHATRGTWGSFWETLLQDNHPPLSFMLIGASAQIFGDGELALRLPAMLFALLEIALLWRLARDNGIRNAGLAALLLAASSLHLDFGTQARMYALHATAVTGCVVCAANILKGKGTAMSRIGLGAWVWIGLHNHYFFLQYGAGLAVGVLFASVIVKEVRPQLRGLFVPVAGAAVLSIPWYALGFAEQWAHALPPGGDDIGWTALIEAYVHLFFLNVRIGSEVPILGSVLREVFILCGGLFTVLALVGAWCGLSRERSTSTRMVTALIGSLAFLVPVGTILLANILPRAGFTWHYILPSTAAMAWLIALGWDCGPGLRTRRFATLTALCGALLLTVLNATGRGSEDYPGAIANLLDQYEEGDAFVSVEWQPPLFPQGMPWDYYAPRLQEQAHERLPMGDQGYSLLNRNDVDEVSRVLLLRTSLPRQQNLFRILEGKGFAERTTAEYGFGVSAMCFERE